MNITLRIMMVIGALFIFLTISRDIKKSRIRMEDSLFWIIFTFVLVLTAIVPQPIYWLSSLCGFQSPSNFILLVLIVLLLYKEFSSSKRISLLTRKIETLAQTEALQEKENSK